MKLSEPEATAIRRMAKDGETNTAIVAVIMGARNHGKDPNEFYTSLVDARKEIDAFIHLERL